MPEKKYKYHVDVKHPKNTGTADSPKFGPSGTRNVTGEKVYTKADVSSYQRTTKDRKPQIKKEYPGIQ